MVATIGAAALVVCTVVTPVSAVSVEESAATAVGGSPDELPELSLTRVLPAQIDRLFEHNRPMEWPADFD